MQTDLGQASDHRPQTGYTGLKLLLQRLLHCRVTCVYLSLLGMQR